MDFLERSAEVQVLPDHKQGGFCQQGVFVIISSEQE